MNESFTVTLPWWIAVLFLAAAALSVVSDILRIYIMRLDKRQKEKPHD